MELFRQEMQQNEKESGIGAILIARPTGASAICALFALLGILIIAYLFIGERTKKTKVVGYTVPASGIVKVYPVQAGTVLSLEVSEGQAISKGQVLAKVTHDRITTFGESRQRVDAYIKDRGMSVSEQLNRNDEQYDKQIAFAKARYGQYQSEIDAIESGIKAQRQKITLLAEVISRDKKLAQENIIPFSDFQEREANFLEQQSRLNELTRQVSMLKRDQISALSEIGTLELRKKITHEELGRARIELAQQAIENADRRESVIVSPTDGIVTAVHTALGKIASTEHPLLSIVPAESKTVVQLFVSSEAMGTVKSGANVYLQYAAFPYQKFGIFKGIVLSVSKVAVTVDELPYPINPKDPTHKETYFVLQVAPEKNYVINNSKKEMLPLGMRVDGDVIGDTRTLIEWIFEPLFGFMVRS
jgi:membrane fusion protein